ncbi:MAG: transglutaminase family protein [Gemmatimonadales bacterium]|nr:transglutaminase family protein [Gemmatimonadales bacterium]
MDRRTFDRGGGSDTGGAPGGRGRGVGPARRRGERSRTRADAAAQPFRPLLALLADFIESCGLERGDDPLATATALRSRLHESFDYIPGTTAVDSPIERILESREGVCQDYAHVMATILRGWGIPTRYVSGYLGPDRVNGGGVTRGESHAWVESWFPGTGWVGFDPTNDTQCDVRHVRVAVGRDYADVPPTRGVFRGSAESMLRTRVTIERGEESCP